MTNRNGTGVSWKAKSLALLQGMNSGTPWDVQEEMYEFTLDAIGPDCALRAVQWAVLNEEWRPTPARLRDISAKIASPFPTAEHAWEEMLKQMNGGREKYSHPLVARAANNLGGASEMYHSHQYGNVSLTTIRKQFIDAYNSFSGTWQEEVADQLRLPAQDRDPKYFGSAPDLLLLDSARIREIEEKEAHERQWRRIREDRRALPPSPEEAKTTRETIANISANLKRIADEKSTQAKQEPSADPRRQEEHRLQRAAEAELKAHFDRLRNHHAPAVDPIHSAPQPIQADQPAEHEAAEAAG